MVVKIFRAIINKFTKGGSARKVIADFFDSIRKLFDDDFGEKWNKLSEGAGASKYKIKSIVDDTFGKLLKVELFENEIRNLPYEAAAFFDEFGNKISKTISQKNEGGVEFTTAEILSAMSKSKGKLSLTHNHPKSSSISYEDIHMFVKNGLNRLRAVTPNGTNYELILKGKLPTFDEYTSKLKLIRKKFANQNQNLIKKVKSTGDDEANNLLKSKYADAILEYLGESVEYVNYK